MFLFISLIISYVLKRTLFKFHLIYRDYSQILCEQEIKTPSFSYLGPWIGPERPVQGPGYIVHMCDFLKYNLPEKKQIFSRINKSIHLCTKCWIFCLYSVKHFGELLCRQKVLGFQLGQIKITPPFPLVLTPMTCI